MPSKRTKQPADRYDTSGNSEAQYMDTNEEVLRNVKGITDLHMLQVEEEKALARAYEQLLGEVRADTPLTAELLRHIHSVIFSGLFEWAGRWRTVRISKPVTNLLAVQTGRLPLQYNMTDAGRDQYIDAAKAAMLKDYGPMIAVIRDALVTD